MKSWVILLSILLLAGCQQYSDYRAHVKQGNMISEKSLHKIERGMSRERVIAVLGTPVYDDTFMPNRLVYIYDSYQSGKHVQKRITITLDNDRVVSIDKRL